VIICLISVSRIIIPSIVVLIIAGTISFFLAYKFYPEEHVNINLNGKCYELVGNAYQKYKNLDAQKHLDTLRLTSYAIKPRAGSIPIVFTGTKEQIANFTNKYDNGLRVVSTEGISPGYTTVDVQIVKAAVTKPTFQKITSELTINDFDLLKKTVGGSIGLQPTPNISSEQEHRIIQQVNQFMQDGIRKIVADGEQLGEAEGVKSYECRS